MVAFGVWVQQVQLICSYEAKIAKLDQHVQTEEEQAGENPQEFSESASSTLAEDVDNEEESSDIIRHRRILVWRCFYFLVSYTIVCVALIIYLLWEERVVPLENRKEYWARNWIAEFAVLPVVVVVSQVQKYTVIFLFIIREDRVVVFAGENNTNHLPHGEQSSNINIFIRSRIHKSPPILLYLCRLLYLILHR